MGNMLSVDYVDETYLGSVAMCSHAYVVHLYVAQPR